MHPNRWQCLQHFYQASGENKVLPLHQATWTVASGAQSLVGAHVIFQTAPDSVAKHTGVVLSRHVLFSCYFTFMLGQSKGSVRIMCLSIKKGTRHGSKISNSQNGFILIRKCRWLCSLKPLPRLCCTSAPALSSSSSLPSTFYGHTYLHSLDYHLVSHYIITNYNY